MSELKNEFSWSVSRDDMFQKCERMYYFQYYGSWEGWDQEADEKTRIIYILKHLQNRQMWAGKTVHDCIENVIRTIKSGHKSINVNQIISRTLNKMRQEFSSSKNKNYLTNLKTCALFEHEYDLEIPDTEWKSNADNVVECLNQFFDSDVYKEILDLSGNQWIGIEKFSYFHLNNTKIYTAIDFAFKMDKDIIIYDWKTGNENPEKDKLQLACYGLFAVQKWDIDPGNVKLVDFYLSAGKQNKFYLSDLDLDQIENYILTSIDKMEKLLEDPKKNIAKEKIFSLTENREICNYCKYKKVCIASI
ncbi:MAG: PD-(D/E)XK nuclease family protein [Promethearchaeota archaeon]